MKHNILSILIDEILNKNKSRGVKVYVQIITTRYFSREWLSKSERISFSPFFFLSPIRAGFFSYGRGTWPGWLKALAVSGQQNFVKSNLIGSRRTEKRF